MSGGGSAELQAKTVTPSTSTIVVTPDAGYDGMSQVTVNGDAELVAGNIRTGVEVFGVTGTYSGEPVTISTYTIPAQYIGFVYQSLSTTNSGKTQFYAFDPNKSFYNHIPGQVIMNYGGVDTSYTTAGGAYSHSGAFNIQISAGLDTLHTNVLLPSIPADKTGYTATIGLRTRCPTGRVCVDNLDGYALDFNVTMGYDGSTVTKSATFTQVQRYTVFGTNTSHLVGVYPASISIAYT